MPTYIFVAINKVIINNDLKKMLCACLNPVTTTASSLSFRCPRITDVQSFSSADEQQCSEGNTENLKGKLILAGHK